MSTLEGSSLRIDLRTTEDGPLFELQGELDVSTAAELWAQIDALEPTGSVTVLDMAGLEFIDSTGISCLYRLHQRVVDGGGMVVARHPSPQIRRLLEMTQLTRLIAVVD